MIRRERDDFLDQSANGRIDNYRRSKLWASMHQPVPNGLHGLEERALLQIAKQLLRRGLSSRSHLHRLFLALAGINQA